MNIFDNSKRAIRFFQGNSKRDYTSVLGYTAEPDFYTYLDKYLRQDIAKRIIDCYPDAIWINEPAVEDEGKQQELSLFEDAFNNLAKKLRLFSKLNKADKLSCLGSFSVLYIGVNDGLSLEEPIDKVSSIEDVLYIHPYSEQHVSVYKYDDNINSKRYGLPEIYEFCLPVRTVEEFERTVSYKVHHSRVIHITEGSLSDLVFGVSRLECVLNRLDDLEKVIGGSAEMFWLNGKGGLNLNIHEDNDNIGEKERDKLKEQVRDFQNHFERIIRTKGVDVKTIEFAVADPRGQVEVILNAISGATGIPKRILTGSESGELASSQDSDNWYSRVVERRASYCEPIILRPFIDKMIEIGALPEPIEYRIIWAELVSLTEKEKAEIALIKSQAISAYTGGQSAELVVPAKQYTEDILNMEYREDDINKALEREADMTRRDYDDFRNANIDRDRDGEE